MKPRIAFTIGDFNGIAPELILKNIDTPSLLKTIQPILIGSFEIFDHYAKKFKTKKKLVVVQSPSEAVPANAVAVVNVYQATVKNLQIGKSAPDAGICAGMSIEKACACASTEKSMRW